MDDGAGMRNHHWGSFYNAEPLEPAVVKNRNLNLQLMPSAADCEMKPSMVNGGGSSSIDVNNGRALMYQRHEAKPFFANSSGFPTEYLQQQMRLDFVQDGWYYHHEHQHHHPYGLTDGRMHYSLAPASVVAHNHQYGFLTDTHTHPSQMMQPPKMIRPPSAEPPMQPKEEPEVAAPAVSLVVEDQEEYQDVKTEAPTKKRRSSKKPKPDSPKPKKQKKPASRKVSTANGNDDKGSMSSNSKLVKNIGIVVNGIDIDLSRLPTPVCSCTGTPQQCYRWGAGGWQSACCTTNMSVHPLPMSTKRRGARIPGRKMSQGAFKKVLEKLSSEGFDLSNPVDLRSFWAKHGTNKFVIIR